MLCASFAKSLGRAVRTAPGLAAAAPARNISSKFGEHVPSPPKLPREQQEEFEKLQKLANSQAAIDEYNRQVEESKVANSDVATTAANATDVGLQTLVFKTIPEFEGDRNPVTGEVGGPKQDPLKHNDWSFNGRVTDF